MKKYKRNGNEQEYIPKNPEKYIGTYPIICRSGWELRFCQYLDITYSIREWASEGIRIKYFDPVRSKYRTYYPDFFVKLSNRRKLVVEIKPLKDCRLPKKVGGKSAKTMAIREATYYTNKAKFKAAEDYCKKLGYEFVVLTENDLFRG
jgi:hypothetical protein